MRGIPLGARDSPIVVRVQLLELARSHLAGKHIEELRGKIAELKGMVATLEHLVLHCHGDERPECPILRDMAKG